MVANTSVAEAPAELARDQRVRASAVVLERPEILQLHSLEIDAPGPKDVVIATEWSAISTGTERLLYQGRMPPFPGMGYPLVPGYESVGRIIEIGPDAGDAVAIGQRVFLGGARCYGKVHALFGGASARLVAPAVRVIPVPEEMADKGVLLALAATAYHALNLPGAQRTELIIGHGVLGRLLARIAALDPERTADRPVVVWETNPARAGGALGYQVTTAQEDTRKDYRAILDASGDSTLLDKLIGRLAPGGEIVLAGFYSEPLQFAFAPAFMREARLLIATEFKPADLQAVMTLIRSGRLSLDGLITHRVPAAKAPEAYRTAFSDPACLKMVLDWRSHS